MPGTLILLLIFFSRLFYLFTSVVSKENVYTTTNIIYHEKMLGSFEGMLIKITFFLVEVLNQMRNKIMESADGSQNSTLRNLIKAKFEDLASF